MIGKLNDLLAQLNSSAKEHPTPRLCNVQSHHEHKKINYVATRTLADF